VATAFLFCGLGFWGCRTRIGRVRGVGGIAWVCWVRRINLSVWIGLISRVCTSSDLIRVVDAVTIGVRLGGIGTGFSLVNIGESIIIAVVVEIVGCAVVI
jgi:hypothetical protein